MGRASDKQVKERYNNFARYYDLVGVFIQLLLGRYRKNLLSGVKGRVLEVGIGTGANLKYYSNVDKLYGVDVSREMLKIAKKKAEKLNVNLTLINKDVSKLPFKNKQFDFIVDTLGLCTYSNPVKVLKEMKRVCKKNGRILLLEHGESSNYFVRKLQKMRESSHNKIGCSLLRMHSDLVKKAGLKIEKIERKLFGIIYIIIAEP